MTCKPVRSLRCTVRSPLLFLCLLIFWCLQSLCCLTQGVDYSAMGQSKEFKAYIKHTAELQRVKLEGMTREETLAFFINIYNALVIHANVVRGPPVTLWQRYKVTVCKHVTHPRYSFGTLARKLDDSKFLSKVQCAEHRMCNIQHSLNQHSVCHKIK